MRRFIAGAAASAVLLGSLALPVFAVPPAQAGPAEKATGGIGYTAGGLERSAQFNAHETVGSLTYEGKGNFSYRDANGDWYRVDVQSVNVAGDYAYFAGPITSASQPGWVGQWLSAAVHDGGEPGEGVDHIWGTFATEALAKSNVASTIAPGPAFAVERGNLQVHSN